MKTTLLYAAVTASQNAANSIELANRTRVHGLQISMFADLDADLEDVTFEISTVPYAQSNQNDSRGILFIGSIGMNLTTQGAVINRLVGFFPVDYTMQAGERLYINAAASGTTLASIACLVHHG